MKILLIHHELPYPLRSGWDKLTYNLLKILGAVHQVTLIVPVGADTNPDSINRVSELCHKLITVPISNHDISRKKGLGWYIWRNLLMMIRKVPGKVIQNYYPALAREVKNLCETGEYGIVQATTILTAVYLKHAHKASTRVLGPMDDGIESARTAFQFEGRLRKKIAAWFEYRASLSYEVNEYKKNDWVLFYTFIDHQRVKALTGGLPHSRHCKVASEVDVISRESQQAHFTQQEANSLIFVGGLAPFFNQDAVIFFCRDIFPRILQRMPGAKLYIVGHNPPAYIKQLERPGQIIITGGVEYHKVPDYVNRAAVYIAPVRAGTGLKTKMIEALSLGKAIVATSAAVAGLWDLGEDVFQICDDPESFAKEVIVLLQDPQRRFALGKRSRALYNRSYSAEAVVAELLAVYDDIERSTF